MAGKPIIPTADTEWFPRDWKGHNTFQLSHAEWPLGYYSFGDGWGCNQEAKDWDDYGW